MTPAVSFLTMKRPSARRIYPTLPPKSVQKPVRVRAVQEMVLDIEQGGLKTLPEGKLEAVAALLTGGLVNEDSLKVASVILSVFQGPGVVGEVADFLYDLAKMERLGETPYGSTWEERIKEAEWWHQKARELLRLISHSDAV
jgi:hypothetical protein